MKKRLLFVLLLTISYITIYSQERGPGDFQGEINGKIIEETSGKPMEYANVSVYRMKDSTLAGGSITDAKGFFSIKKLKPGSYRVKIEFIGFERKTVTAKVNPQTPVVNVGTISLKSANTTLGQVDVVDSKPLVEFSLDKKIINVEKNISAVGGSATDILRNTPSVSVDMDGNVALRGSTNVTILVDGKPSLLSSGNQASILEQIPANSIETIEIITNPSAKYDPEGMSGIINIKTKKEKQEGINGLATVSYGTWNKYSGSLSLNYRTGKFNFYGNYDIRDEERTGYRKHDRTMFVNDTATYYYIFSEDENKMQSQNFKGGFDYEISSGTNLTFSASHRIGGHPGDQYGTTRIYDYANSLEEYYHRDQKNSEDNRNTDFGLNFRKAYPGPQHELTADLYYSMNNEDESSLYDQYWVSPLSSGISQRALNNGENKNLTFQTDYSHPFSDSLRLDGGFKFQNRQRDEDYVFGNYDSTAWDYLPDTNLSNHFVYTDYVSAVYTTFSAMWKKFSVQAGLRAEHTYLSADQKTLNEEYTNQYLGLFPSIHTSYSLPHENKLQISYSRRINRPSMHSLNPFRDASDPLTVREGNPYLKPEYINSYEIAHIKDWKNISLTSSVFYKQINDVISRYRLPSDSGSITVTFVNIAKGYSSGLDFVVSGKPMKMLRLTADFSYFLTAIEGTEDDNDLTSSIYSYNAKFNASLNLPKEFSIQLSANVEGPSVQAQSIREGFWSMEAGLRKEMFDRKLTVAFRFSDIFNTMRFRVNTDDGGLIGHMEFKRETQVAYLSLTWKINEGVKQKEKRRSQDGGGGDMDYGE